MISSKSSKRTDFFPPITLSIDLEDSTGIYSPFGKYIETTKKILDLCDEFNCRATFFVVGKIASSSPSIIKDISAKGHEIAYHSREHIPLTKENPSKFKLDSRADKETLEQICGKQVVGFRAPCFSLTPSTIWALDILKENGFSYSSSVMPTRISRFGFSGAPHIPFLWPNGIVEFPMPVGAVGNLRIPYLGGVYLYALPFSLTKWWLKKTSKKECPWTYFHPFDLEKSNFFEKLPDVPLWVNLIMKILRTQAEKKIRLLISLGTNLPFREILASENFQRVLKYYKSNNQENF